jgi:rRNA maturation protein Rpf1
MERMFTTSRYASSETRGLAKRIAQSRGERYAARGKKTIACLAAEARRLGEAGISVIEERAGRAAIVALIEVDERGGWRWAGEKPFNPSEIDNRKERKG